MRTDTTPNTDLVQIAIPPPEKHPVKATTPKPYSTVLHVTSEPAGNHSDEQANDQGPTNKHTQEHRYTPLLTATLSYHTSDAGECDFWLLVKTWCTGPVKPPMYREPGRHCR